MADVRRAPALILLSALLLSLGLFVGCGSDDEGPAAPTIDTVPPAIPNGVSGVVHIGNDPAIHLSWDANVTDADLAGYVVYRSNSASGGFEAVGPAMVSGNAWVDQNVDGGKTYYYRVSARDANANESGLSQTAALDMPDDLNGSGNPRIGIGD